MVAGNISSSLAGRAKVEVTSSFTCDAVSRYVLEHSRRNSCAIEQALKNGSWCRYPQNVISAPGLYAKRKY